MLSNAIDKTFIYLGLLKRKPLFVFSLFYLYAFLLVGSASCDCIVQAENTEIEQPANGQESGQRYSFSQLSGEREQEKEPKEGLLERLQGLSSREKKILVASLIIAGCLIGVLYLQGTELSQLRMDSSRLDDKVSKLNGEVCELKNTLSQTVKALGEKVGSLNLGSGHPSNNRSIADQETWVRPPGWKFGFG